MTRREAWLTRRRRLPARHRRPRARRPRHHVPRSRGHRLLRGGCPQPHRRAWPHQRRAVELPDAAAGRAARRVRGLAAAAHVPRCAAHGAPRRHLPRGAGVGRAGGCAGPGAGLAPRRRRGGGTRPASRPGPHAGPRCGARRVRVRPAGGLRCPPRLDDAVRGAGARGVPADGPDPARPAGGAAPRRAAAGPRCAAWAGSPGAQRGAVGGAHVGAPCLVRDRPPRTTAAGRPWRRRGAPDGGRTQARPADPPAPDRDPGRRGDRDLRALDGARLAGVRLADARPDAGQRPLRERVRHLRLAGPPDARALPRAGDRRAPGRARRGLPAQPRGRPASAGRPGRADRARRAALAGARRARCGRFSCSRS